MASINLPTISRNTYVVSDLTTINNNFTLLKEAINRHELYLDTDTQKISISDITVKKGVQAISAVIMRCEASVNVSGNVVVAEGVTSKTLTVGQGITLTDGNLALSGVTKELTNAGSTKLSGSLVLTHYGTNFIEASNPSTYESANVSGTTATLTTTNIHGIMLDFSGYEIVTNVIQYVKLPAPAVPGQIITIFGKIGSVVTPMYIKPDNIGNLLSTEKLRFDSDYSSVDMVAVGSVWVYRNLNGMTKV